jgi:hypothetical protein
MWLVRTDYDNCRLLIKFFHAINRENRKPTYGLSRQSWRVVDGVYEFIANGLHLKKAKARAVRN